MELKDYIGIPYIKHGRSLEGADCYGLVYLYYKNTLGIDLPIFLNEYETKEDVQELIKKETSILPFIERVDNPREGDIVEMNFMGLPIHLGIYLERNKILHVLPRTNSVIQTIKNFELRGTINGYYKYTG